jgi:hypothetical protein
MVQTISPPLETQMPNFDRPDGRSIFLESELLAMYFADLMSEGCGVVSQETKRIQDEQLAETVILDVRNKTASASQEFGWQHTLATTEGVTRSRLKVNSLGHLFCWQVEYNKSGQTISTVDDLSEPKIQLVWEAIASHKLNMISNSAKLRNVKDGLGRSYSSFLFLPIVQISQPKEFVSQNAQIVSEYVDATGQEFVTINVRLHGQKREEEAKRRHGLWKKFGVTALKPIEL